MFDNVNFKNSDLFMSNVLDFRFEFFLLSFASCLCCTTPSILFTLLFIKKKKRISYLLGSNNVYLQKNSISIEVT